MKQEPQHRFKTRTILASLGATLVLCSGLRAQAVSRATSLAGGGPAVQNLGVSSFLGPDLDGMLVAFVVSEYQEGGTDLNGDGDADDYVIHVYIRSTGQTLNLGLASTVFDVHRGHVAFLVNEGSQGGTDLNGDGDAFDQVAHLYSVTSGTTLNLGVAEGIEALGPRMGGNLLTLIVDEFSQGDTDLNNDGDTQDQYVLFVHDLTSGVTTNLGFAAPFTGVLADGDRLAFPVYEYWQGGADLNGDGDDFDTVLHIYDAAQGTTTNVGVAVSQSFAGRMLGDRVFVDVVEGAQGQVDLNNDGDANDRVAFLYDAGSGQLTNLGLALSYGRPLFAEDFLAFSVDEQDQGDSDLNGDGDLLDSILHVHKFSTGATTSLGLSSASAVVGTKAVAFRVWEGDQGQSDLNGDGDALDTVLHVHNVATGTTTNMSIACEFDFQMSSNIVAFRVSESAHGVTDLNGDGDTGDTVLHYLHVGTGTTTNLELGLTYNKLDIRRGRIIFLVAEDQQGAVLNGDGDQADDVLHILDVTAGPPENLELAVRDFRLSRKLLAFEVSESEQGQSNLNGDGDAVDNVLHVVQF